MIRLHPLQAAMPPVLELSAEQTDQQRLYLEQVHKESSVLRVLHCILNLCSMTLRGVSHFMKKDIMILALPLFRNASKQILVVFPIELR